MTDSPRWSGAGTLCPWCGEQGVEDGTECASWVNCDNLDCPNFGCSVAGWSDSPLIALRARIEALEAERDAAIAELDHETGRTCIWAMRTADAEWLREEAEEVADRLAEENARLRETFADIVSGALTIQEIRQIAASGLLESRAAPREVPGATDAAGAEKEERNGR